MSDPVYVIQLGSGLYLDDRGLLHQGPIPSVPSYVMPGGALATANEAAKLSKTFRDIGDALPSKPDATDGKDAFDKFEKFSAKLADLGLPNQDLAKLLGVVGKIAETVGTVFVVLGVAVAAAKLLGLFNEGPSPLEVLVKARFDALDREIRALHALAVQKDLGHQRDALAAARSTVQSFVAQRDSGTMTAAQIESRLQTLITELSLLSANQILALLDPITYTVLFDTEQYSKVWPWIVNWLFRVPAGSTPQRATFPIVNAAFFDHRLAVALAPQAAQTFLVLVRSLTPEFRTTGDFRPTLRDFAEKLTSLAESVRNATLARTIYSEGDFGWLIDDFYVIDSQPGIIKPTLKPDYTMVVGAMDLCNHDDAFFADVAKPASLIAPGSSRRGSLDFRWHPPATLERVIGASGLVHSDGSPITQYRITNPKECADIANEISLQDYSDVMLSSGYLTLVQLAAQMHHAATQPDKSETVQGEVLLLRLTQPGSTVTVVSAPGPILFTKTGEIKAEAWREPQQVRAFATATTQRIPRTAPLISYRVLLRTVASALPPRVWTEPNYESVQWGAYRPDPLHPGFQRLVLTTSSNAVLQEEVLMEGSSITAARPEVNRSLDFKAHTFDWWIPQQPRPGVTKSAVIDAPGHHVVGNVLPRTSPLSPNPLPNFQLSSKDFDPANAASVVMGLGWEDGAQSQGHHREMQEAMVQMRVKLDWQGSNIRLAIENRPQDRNYVVFLVIEETFGSVESDEQAPKVLHTAFPIAINGQLTYVPQSLFDEETAASNKQRAFAQKYAISVNPKPGHPVIKGVTERELSTDAGVERLAAAIRQFDPAALETLTRAPHD